MAILCSASNGYGQERILSDGLIEQRLRFIEERLEDRKQHGQLWYASWMMINAGSAIGHTVAAMATDDNDDTVKFATIATLAAIGVGDLLLRPLETRLGYSPVDALPETTRRERMAKLHAAEDQLRRNAERAAGRWSLLEHGANAGLATAAALVVGIWGKPSDSAVVGLASLLGGTVNLLSQPAAPEQDWKDYKSMIGGRSRHKDVGVHVTALPGGAKLSLRIKW